MKNPFTYRPLATEEDGWEDNTVSNTLAYLSETFIPKACKEPGHWTNKITLYVWADCACCLFFRGVLAGASLTALVAAGLCAIL